MADCKHGTEKGLGKSNDEGFGQGTSSPVDCWELVESLPSSPLPEATVDGSALEAAVGAACSSGGSLHDYYFACPRNLPELHALPLSTVMTDRQSEEEANSSDRSDAVESVDNETAAIAKRDEYNEVTQRADHMQYDDYMLHHEDRQLDYSACHDDNAYHMFLDDDATRLELSNNLDDAHPIMYKSEMMEYDDILPAVNEMYNHNSACSDEGNMNHTSAGVEITRSGPNGQQMSTFAIPNDSELSGTSHVMQDNSIEAHPTSIEGDGDSPTALGGVGRESSGLHENLQGSLINTHSIRISKAFTCASWLWTQFCRWQAHLGYANTIWSMAFTAAVMGILVLGRGLQRLQAQNYSLRSQLWAKEKRITQLMFQLLQTKRALTKTRRVPVICVKPALQVPQGQV